MTEARKPALTRTPAGAGSMRRRRLPLSRAAPGRRRDRRSEEEDDMASRTEEAPLAETLWRLGAVAPWFGGGGLAEMAEPSRRHPVALAMLRGMQQGQQDAVQGALAMADTAVRHALDAGQRLMAARDPVEAMAAQTGLALAFGELAGAPVRAWLDALPKLHECCIDAARQAKDTDHGAAPERRTGADGTGPAAATG
ncbi:hypothetical protein DFH01_25430 [Falsiroseomonas bella]|uniref:Phasin domain-containing protein n=1 Tax=Falsiroseomonas bella TaxID=2184016 RepID=A0A317F5F6_9PROT|nr:phasin family protein [Falsiroseomonas bella]PWS34364.1 hypothetical protein DFH01_25430 [Falsiroseomonas bella]